MSVRHICFHNELLTLVKFSGLTIVSNKENLVTRRSSPKCIVAIAVAIATGKGSPRRKEDRVFK